VRQTFACFGGRCAVEVAGDAPEALARARARLLGWHDRFTRFAPGSELSQLNADARDAVPVSEDLAALIEAIVGAARTTAGLVDGMLAAELEQAGYRRDLGPPLPLGLALRLAPRRAPARPRPGAPWRAVSVGNPAPPRPGEPRRDAKTAGAVVRRPPGLAFDGGGVAKGLCADLLAAELAEHARFAVDCAGDLRLGGAAARARRVEVADPFGRAPVAAFELTAGAVATSGIGRRSWLGSDGRPAHHLLDPATGRPAFTGVVQATALAPTALEAEVLAKAALLSGPDAAVGWLPHGGALVTDDGARTVFEPPAVLSAA
jgi:thiamine biosynthesis lipoprotein